MYGTYEQKGNVIFYNKIAHKFMKYFIDEVHNTHISKEDAITRLKEESEDNTSPKVRMNTKIKFFDGSEKIVCNHLNQLRTYPGQNGY